MRTARVVVVGSANADVVVDVDHRPADGETVLGSDAVVSPGGKGANQAVAAGRLGGHVAFVGCVGDDAHGRMLRTSISEAGVDVSALRTVQAPTGTAIILITPDGENSIVVAPGANRLVDETMIDQVTWAAGDVLVVQLEIPLPTVEHAVRRARRADVRVVVNAAPAALLPAPVLEAADPLVVNESEAALLVSGSTAPSTQVPVPGPASDTVRRLLELGPRSVVLTLGAQGAVLGRRDPAGAVVLTHVEAREVTAIDTTGAGDAFVGALALGLAEDAPLDGAVVRATDVAACAVGRRGAQDSYPTSDELSAMTRSAPRVRDA
ncbi:ribokinase [Cellulomonas carbonis]|uniref:Ribokinase n=1 Tax=Cellulomonas carbonis T26 TaxID=947969 RepID=A0A0A0BXI2_9CELL|nr:ribokinase [Cellulomonas carbonis]KGM12621.1 ribokinase [Cellulomonas carbonis T26]GGC06071.1 ribokinase [Cellulomonas carbonis]